MGSEQSTQPGNKSSEKSTRLKRDSPKLVSKHLSRAKSAQMKSSLLKKASQITSSTGHNIVVVKEAAPEAGPDSDPELQRLKNIPMFLPIMRGTVNLPEARDPEVLERLDSAALYRLCVHYQEYLTSCATTVAKDQALIFDDMKRVDSLVSSLVKSYTECEAQVNSASERLHRIPDLSMHLSHTHLLLNQTVDTLERLNNSLPLEHRLEPFVWTTG
ncbi:BLOC-1-related complex subunit 5 isoform X2 [Diaphorina citri]|uniref:BLOC-1-related complex subunit 5 n=1 Tax=Diaphorina citri TaxID=121845 RepID=A0A3Q0J063_DIACI|nr:BLOC-1-related complex subunit 5 isoform X2 [Diaphorina citri]